MTDNEIKRAADAVAAGARADDSRRVDQAALSLAIEQAMREAQAPLLATVDELVEKAQKCLDDDTWGTRRALQDAIDRARELLP